MTGVIGNNVQRKSMKFKVCFTVRYNLFVIQDSYTRQLEFEDALRVDLGQKIEKLETAVQRLEAIGQQKDEKIQELIGWVEAVYLLGYLQIVATEMVPTPTLIHHRNGYSRVSRSWVFRCFTKGSSHL